MVVAAAVVDAVRRGGGDPAPPATTALAGRSELAGQLTRLGARGELVLYDAACGVRLLALPSLEQTGDDTSGCVPNGALSPDGSAIARCRGDDTEVLQAGGSVVAYRVRGCTPAWRPDGTLTVSQRQAVTRACPVEVACHPVTLIPRTELERAARRHPSFPDIPTRVRTLIEGIAWLSSAKAAVSLSIRVSRFDGRNALSAIAFFEDGRLTDAQPYYRMTGGRLGVSPRGTYVTMLPDVILRGDGSRVSLPQHVREAHAFAWTEDERFLAVATRFGVTVLDVASLDSYDTIGSGLRSVTLPLSVTELAWR